jgi:mannosyltransferase
VTQATQTPLVPHQRGPSTAATATDGLALPAWMPSVLPALLMLVTGLVGLTRPSLGWDENATATVSRRPIAQLVDLAGNFDGVIAPYYGFMHAWTAVFGDSEFALRAPSLLTVAVGVGLAGELGRRLFTPAVGLLGGLFLVAVPQLSRYAQDARVYGIAFMLATLASLLLYRALERPGRGRWVAYAGTVALLGVAHVLGLLVLAGHAVAVVGRWRSTRDGSLRGWLVAAAAGVLPVLPLVLLGLTERGDQLDWIEPMKAGIVLAAPGAVFGSAAVGLLVIGLALTVRWPDRVLVREFTAAAVLPPAVLIGVSFATSSLWVPRYVMVVLPALCLLAAAALLHPGRSAVRAAAALLLLVAVGLPAQREVRGPASHHGPDFRAVGAVVAREQRPGDAVVYGRTGTWSLRAGLDYQLRGGARPRDVLLARSAAQIGQLGAQECTDEVGCLGAAARVWFFQVSDADATPDAGGLTATLARDYRQVRVWPVAKGLLVLYERV